MLKRSSIIGALFISIALFISWGCSDTPTPKQVEIPECTCGLLQPALTLECMAPFDLTNVQIKSQSDSNLKEVELRGIQRFDDSPLMNVGIDYEFDCTEEYTIVLNESENYTFHIKGMKFEPVAYYPIGKLKYFCDLYKFYVNDSLTRYNRFYLKIANKD